MKHLWVCLVTYAVLVAGLLVLEFDAYGNASNSSRPGIAALHGGYWYEDSGWATWPRYFADRGYAVLSIGYRLNSDAAWPIPRADAIPGMPEKTLARIEAHL
ncbi:MULTISPECIES: hypothetical protein [unclassified Streptomyces]|uniref:hypothetical protein n=1 Tax=unclassified Streptomyces TaxID=2593676 RepID=UPI000DC3265A|nr:MULTISPECIES: hypothetical protein [unclassified Streptomyces]MYT73798.1 hypothetical protein [Streptomyces sp. SID8367]RAJ89209.1 hypothetical protein K377_01334 [Streptomyces sp. PsTaAH-137]